MNNWIDLCVLVFVLYLQIRNLMKYGATNGALKKRIIMMASVAFLIVHVIRLMFDITTGFFLLLHVLTWLALYDAINFQWLIDRFKKSKP